MVLPHIALVRFFTRMLDVSGRASRSEFWFGYLLSLLLLGAVTFALTMATLYLPTLRMAFGLPLLPLIGLWGCATITAQMRRLHDIGNSGLWLLLGFVPIVGGLILLVKFCQSSQDEANRWGPPGDGPMRPLREAPSTSTAPGPKGAKHDPWKSYGVLLQGDAADTPAMQEARKAEISDYYRRNILKQPSGIPAE